ncbi:MAG TPA: serine hydrolase [Candidatus Paceibacterota bacterium]|jgi:D-alanyl-D-alanine endopeptidase (penicillin-binding protein 7)|nr:serine hydrolase [Candidatus Paceibacterota bacterium]
MHFSSRSLIFFVAVCVLTGIGVFAGYHNASSLSEYDGRYASTKSVDAATDVQGSAMVAEEPFITASSATSSPSSTVDAGNTSVAVKKKPAITALSYIVGNVETGEVYISSNSNKVLPVASMSKLITAIIATNTISPTTTIEITPMEANVASDTSNIGPGEKFSFKEILYPLLLNSSNVAAEAIASSTDRDHFLQLMSSTAWEVNMPTAFFADPSGLDPRNNASAKDMFALAQYLYHYRPDILEITRIPHVTVATTSDHGAHNFDSIHPFVTDPRFIGGKTGRTYEAGETMLTILRIADKPIAFIILHSAFGERAADTDILIRKFEQLSEE